jgi:diphosphomevalonate decarboxylase
MEPHTALANPNIAFIKYWGNNNEVLRLPSNGSISMNLSGLETKTTVQFDEKLQVDHIRINGTIASGAAHTRVHKMLNKVRALAEIHQCARVESENNFPSGAGIASSASAFASLALASSAAAGLDLSEVSLSLLARQGSGSACRSIPGGFVEWIIGTGEADSYAFSIAPPGHWDLVDCIIIISSIHKSIGSTRGHALAKTSPYQSTRIADSTRRLDICRQAILKCDFSLLADIVEIDSNMMHAVMMTSHPPLFYWQPATLEVMQRVRTARENGMDVCYTIDAGPNVHVICTADIVEVVIELLGSIPGVEEVRRARVGGPARLIETQAYPNYEI